MKAATRNKLPGKDFAGPGRSFPINDKKHARLAIGGATRSERAGNISASEANKIKAEAREKLGKRPNAARGGMVHDGSMKGTNFHSDRPMHRERY